MSEYTQVIEEPMHNPKTWNFTEVKAFLTTSTIQVVREQKAFSMDDLVADSGGVLGLFIGFNFLMLWEWIVGFIKIICRKIRFPQE